MRNGQNNKRMRNRNNNNNNKNNNNRRGQNPMTRVFESNGPDIKIRGTASHVAEKYVQLARDARSSGDPVAAENYYQHAEHYFRLIAAAQEQFRQNQPQPRTENEMAAGGWRRRGRELFDISGRSPASFRCSRSRSCRATTATTMHAITSAKDSPTSSATSTSPANTAVIANTVRSRSFSRSRSRSRPLPDGGSVDRLPSFITGPQPQINGGPGSGFEGGDGERFPRRRRRPHGPRPEGMAAPAAPSDDFNPGNE